MASESDRHAARIDFALMTHSTVPLTQLTRVGARQDFVPVISVDDGSTSSVAYSFSREQFTTFLQPLDELELENQLQNTTVHAMEAEQPWGVIADVFRVVDVR
jgi:hypothetical protein